MNNLQKALTDIADEIDEIARDAGVSGDLLAVLRRSSESLRKGASYLDGQEELDPREALEQFSEKRQVVVEESAEQAGYCERCGTALSKSMLGGSSCHMCGWSPDDPDEALET